MAAPDPASEALIRKLHRELNGFTRRSRYPPQPENPGPRKVQQDRKGPDSVTPSEDQSDKGLNSRPTSEGDQPSADHGKAKAKREKPDAAERPAKLARRTSPTNAGGVNEDKSRAGADKPVVVAVPAPPAVPVLPLTPLEEAAALASAMTRTKTKQASRPSHAPAAGMKVIKCFHAGIRWGITLTADAIKRRSDLATALNDAFAGQILSCGRGDMLHVVFLDESGQAEEFPALRSDIKESASQWKACVDKAVRVYVMR